jgi:ferredoxin-nitrite reductase
VLARAPFSDEQRRYLDKLFAGALRRRQPAADQDGGDSPLVHGVPADELSREERIKHERNPLDIWDTVLANAAQERFPEPDDVFRYKFHGLFHTAPAQDGYMCRLRLPANVLSSRQLRGLAALAGDYAGGYADLTTRGNLQLREVGARHAPDLLMGLYDLGLTARGAGADNIRNVTATPTSGFDPQELCDVSPQARALHHYILHSRDLYGLPRKFNVAFDSGGQVSVAGATNDIALRAVRVPKQAVPVDATAGGDADRAELAPGVYFRVLLGGITGHGSFASDAGIVVPPERCVAVAAAMLRVFASAGDRTNRKRARLKYVLERWGIERFVTETEAQLGATLPRLPLECCNEAAPVVRGAHVGTHRQRQPGFNWVGVGVPGGRLSGACMTALADLAERFGTGEMRLTVFQNPLIPHVADRDIAALAVELERIGLSASPSSYAAGTVACTGNAGCKFAMTDTKGTAVTLARHLERNAPLDGPINIHVTGCPNSCAQHYCGDIGLLGVGSSQNGEPVEAYNVLFGGGMDQQQALAEEAYRAVPAAQLPALLTRVMRAYLSHRRGSESFNEFIRRHGVATVTQLAGDAAAAGVSIHGA